MHDHHQTLVRAVLIRGAQATLPGVLAGAGLAQLIAGRDERIRVEALAVLLSMLFGFAIVPALMAAIRAARWRLARMEAGASRVILRSAGTASAAAAGWCAAGTFATALVGPVAGFDADPVVWPLTMALMGAVAGAALGALVAVATRGRATAVA